ncbi:MAG: HlyC/CorC family transporter [Desulfovibrio sp.]|nr:HlyC/CorC family transporter [Desulfovibrio sp.]
MLTLVLAVAVAVSVSFTCSLLETVLYSVPWSAIERLRRSGGKAGKLLFRLRSEVDKPIAAVLTLNTIANTAGATIAGAAFLAVFGPEYMTVFAAGFTILILAFGEIVPKNLGVVQAERLAPLLARPLSILVRVMGPLLQLTSLISQLVAKPSSSGPVISEDDIRAVTSLSRQAGRIKPYEEAFVRNVLSLDQKRVHEIMTPRTVVFELPETLTVEEAYSEPRTWHFSRIPVYGDDNEDIVGFVERRTMGRCVQEGRENLTLADIMRPAHFILETQTLDVLLHELLAARVHLFTVLDEYGGLAGVVSLEDVLEEILGREIVDESDKVDDLRALARQRRRELSRSGRNDGAAAVTGSTKPAA